MKITPLSLFSIYTLHPRPPSYHILSWQHPQKPQLPSFSRALYKITSVLCKIYDFCEQISHCEGSLSITSPAIEKLDNHFTYCSKSPLAMHFSVSLCSSSLNTGSQESTEVTKQSSDDQFSPGKLHANYSEEHKSIHRVLLHIKYIPSCRLEDNLFIPEVWHRV